MIVTLMKLTSATARAEGSGVSVGWRLRALTPSRRTTLGSVRVNAEGAALQQAVCEAAGGGADVEADFLGGIDGPMVEGLGEFVAAAGDVGGRGGYVDGSVEVDFFAGFVGTLAVDLDLAGEDEGFGLFAGAGQTSFEE